jgi:hypothetical protein
MNLMRLSRIAGYAALVFLALALSNIGIVFLTTQGHEFMAKLAYWELIASFVAFLLWAITATIISVLRNRETK